MLCCILLLLNLDQKMSTIYKTIVTNNINRYNHNRVFLLKKWCWWEDGLPRVCLASKKPKRRLKSIKLERKEQQKQREETQKQHMRIESVQRKTSQKSSERNCTSDTLFQTLIRISFLIIVDVQFLYWAVDSSIIAFKSSYISLINELPTTE